MTNTMPMNPKRICAVLLALVMMLGMLPCSAGAEKIQDCHRVKLTHTDTTQDNGSVIRIWSAETVLPAVDA